MKTLEQLGISPAPWRKAVNNFGMGENIIWDANCHLVQYSGLNPNLPYEMHEANHSMIVAAPELYEALRMYQEVFEKIRNSAWFIDANFHEIMSINKVMTAADAALAKAGGEE